jgi:hypothetical protein
MKKLILLTLAALLIFAACSVGEFSPEGEQSYIPDTEGVVELTTTPPIATTTANEVRTEPVTVTTEPPSEIRNPGPILGDRYADNVELLHFGESPFARHFNDRHFYGNLSSVAGAIGIYIGHFDWSDSGYWTGTDYNFSTFQFVTNLMESCYIYAAIINYNISDEFLIEAFEISAASYRERGFDEDLIFTPADIKALLTRDEATVLAHFASPYAIVIHDRVYTPAWIYRNTTEGYRAAGITPAMIAEKLPLWQEFGFTDEARTAFEGKLTEFVGVEVSLARE